jgi:hypothetical protein
LNSQRLNSNRGRVRRADCHCHPADLNGNGIAKQKPAAVERLHLDPCIKAKVAKTPPLSLAEQRPIDAEDFPSHLARQIIELHAAPTPLTAFRCD